MSNGPRRNPAGGPHAPLKPERKNPKPERKNPKKGTTWIGVAASALVGLAVLLSSGVLSALMFVSLILLVTAGYAWAFRRRTWMRLPAKRASAAVAFVALLAILIGSSTAYVGTHPAQSVDATATVASSQPTKASSASVSAAARKQLAAHNAAVARQKAAAHAAVVAHEKDVAAAKVRAAAAQKAAAQAAAAQAAAAQAAASKAAASQAAQPPPANPAPPAAQTAYIIPGAYCPAADVGQVAEAANGRYYKCGGHGADAHGDYHWNTM